MAWLVSGLEISLICLCFYTGMTVIKLSRAERNDKTTKQSSLDFIENNQLSQNDDDNEIIVVEEGTSASTVLEFPTHRRSNKSRYQTKQEALKQIQMFNGSQMLAVKREFNELYSNELHWMREAIAYYLIGAADLIAKQAGCEAADRQQCIRLTLQSQLRINPLEAESLHAKAIKRTRDDDVDEMVTSGARAAMQWQNKRQVKSEISLREQLNTWGVFA